MNSKNITKRALKPIPKAEKQFECNRCEVRFTQKKSLTKHVSEVHERIQLFVV